MKSLYRSVTLAALVVGSSLALLTGAQADIIDFGPRTNTANFNFSNFNPNTVQMQNNATSGPASFDGRTGTFTWANTVLRLSGLSADGANFDTVTNALGNPAPVSFSVDFLAGNNMSGTVTLAQVANANTTDMVTLIGTFLVNASGGVLASAFPVGSREPFEWMLSTTGSTTPADVLTASTTATFSGGIGTVGVPGPIVGAGLPGLIAVLGGLVAMARRRRKQLA